MVSQITILAVIACIGYAFGSPIIDAIHHPQPFKFGYSIKDHHGEQHREEASNGVGGVVGSYGFTDDRGIARQVNYVADHAGFRAAVKTNEPGTANQNPAAVQIISNDPYAQGAAVPYVSRPGIPVVPALAIADPVYGLGNVHQGAHVGLAHEPVYGHHGVYGLGHEGVYGLVDGVYGHGLGHEGVYGLAHRVHGHGLRYGGYGLSGALGYSGLLGGGYGGVVNYGGPLVGGAIKSYDSRIVNAPLVL